MTTEARKRKKYRDSHRDEIIARRRVWRRNSKIKIKAHVAVAKAIKSGRSTPSSN